MNYTETIKHLFPLFAECTEEHKSAEQEALVNFVSMFFDKDSDEVYEDFSEIHEERQRVSIELEIRGMKASKNFLMRKGYEIIAESHGELPHIVAQVDDAIHFVFVVTREGVFAKESVSRSYFEQVASKWLMANDRLDCVVKGDIITLNILGEERAMLRHHEDAFGKDWDAK